MTSLAVTKKIGDMVVSDPASLAIVGLGACCLLGVLVVLILAVKLRRSRKEVRRLLEVPPDHLPLSVEERLPVNAGVGNLFDQAVFEAETRKKLKEGLSGRDIPEKYRYAPCLLRRGLKNEEIAEVLRLSCEEVEQIAKLTHIVLQADKSSLH